MLLSCSFIDSSVRVLPVPENFSIDSPEFLESINALAEREMRSGNHLELLRTGDETFIKLRQMLLSAKHHIHIENYLFNTDSLTREITQILINKSLSGVKVVLIVDSVGGYYFEKEHENLLRQNGIEVYIYNQWNTLNPFRYRIRNHRRSFVIDGKYGLMGGFGLTAWWANPQSGPYPVDDVQVYIEGPSVNQLQSIFAQSYRSVSGKVLAGSEYYPDTKKAGEKIAVITATNPDQKESRSNLYEIYQLLIQTSRQEIIIVSPYFILDRTFIDLFKLAKSRNVRVKLILTDEKFIFEKPVAYSASSFFEELLDSGIEIYIYQKGLLHSKMGIIDRQILIVGSSNFDQRSHKINLENDMIIPDPQLASDALVLVDEYIENSVLLTQKQHQERSYWSRCNEFLWIPLMHEF